MQKTRCVIEIAKAVVVNLVTRASNIPDSDLVKVGVEVVINVTKKQLVRGHIVTVCGCISRVDLLPVPVVIHGSAIFHPGEVHPFPRRLKDVWNVDFEAAATHLVKITVPLVTVLPHAGPTSVDVARLVTKKAPPTADEIDRLYPEFDSEVTRWAVVIIDARKVVRAVEFERSAEARHGHILAICGLTERKKYGA